jgi:tetratricopeptide (TPR) repeat protein
MSINIANDPLPIASEGIALKENMQSINTNVVAVMNSDASSSVVGTTTNHNVVTTSTANHLKKPPPSSLSTITFVDSSLPRTGNADSTIPNSEMISVTAATASSSSSSVIDQTKPQVLVPSYESSEESVYYKTAKALLQSGDFETALSTIEDGIEWTKQQLIQNATTNGWKEAMSTTAVVTTTTTTTDLYSLHESLAPFHYLYGTTLLYSIEESTDGLQPLTTVEGGSTIMVPDEDDDDDNEHSAGGGTYGSSNDQDENEESPVTVEDIEIAWENLDTARTILEQMITKHPQSQKLRTDMAQILLREGDLQRQNGNYAAAVTDYTTCLAYYENNSLVPRFSRKMADVHCNLGSVYVNLVVETQKGIATPSDAVDGTNGTAIDNTMHDRDRPEKIIFYRNRGFYHYYECAKILAGIIIELSDAKDPIELFQCIEEEHTSQISCCNERSENYPDLIRSKLTSLRQKVTTMTKSMNKVSSSEDSDLISDSLAVLEEIQETMDEAETSEQGVVEATAMKDEITALVAAQQQGDDGEAATDASTTTSNPFGSVAATASTAMAQPIMVVKKKNKRTEVELIDEDGMDVKLPAKNDVVHNKRIKSSE